MIGRTPNTFIVGAGPVAATLSGALRQGGVPVLGLWARNPPAARAASAVAGVAAYSAAPPDLLLEAEVVILAVRDDAITEVAKMLVATGLVTRKHILLHCSGALSAEDAFSGVRDQVGGVGVLHPLRAIPDAKTAMADLEGTVFGVQGDAEGLRAASDLCSAVAGRPLQLTREQMATYHAAAAVASNFTVVLLDVASRLLQQSGIDHNDGLAALTALAQGTLSNVQEKGLPQALTGPVRRGDSATVQRHLRALRDGPDGALAIYREMARWAVEMARACGDADEGDLNRIQELLQDAPASRSLG